MSTPVTGPLRAINPIATVLILLALLVALLVGIAPGLNARIKGIGEQLWPGYAAELRAEPIAPECDVAELEAQLEACPAATAPSPAPADPFGGADPFAEPAPAKDDPFGGNDPFAAPAPAPADPFGGADPFAEPEPAKDDPFGGDDPFAEPEPAPAQDDPFGGNDPFAAPGAAPAPTNCPALRNLHQTCKERHATYAATLGRITPEVRRFRALDLAISDLTEFPFHKHLLCCW